VKEKAYRKQFGLAVRAAREQAGWTQRELAESAEIAEKYLSRIELGISTPSAFVAYRLAKALKLEASSLVDPCSPKSQQSLAAIERLLSGRTPKEIDLALRLLSELFR